MAARASALVLACTLLVGLLGAPAGAVQPGEMLSDAALETRARRLSQELRCVVCQNQSIDDSNAPLAQDLRILVRERLRAGESDDQVLAFVVARYGEFVLLRPRLKPETVLLWLAPLLLLGGAVFAIVRARSRAAAPGPAGPLSAQERARLDELLGDQPRDG